MQQIGLLVIMYGVAKAYGPWVRHLNSIIGPAAFWGIGGCGGKT